jgi:peptide chain release factor 2
MPAPRRKFSTVYGGFFDVPGKTGKLKQIEDRVEADPNFWNDPQKSAPVLKEKKALETAIERSTRLRATRDDLEVAIELAEGGDRETLAEAESLLLKLKTELTELEAQALLSGEVDLNDAVVTINAGAGGTESCDWAQMLMRMYLRYAERKGWTTEIYDVLDGDGAGIKNCTFEVKGPYAFGMLKAESGVHRLIRISPFDSNARRQTSFAAVYVSPVIDDTINIEINPADLEIGTFRASGAGGQHVNKTESAVRIKHVPSGIVVASQTQRSQHQNRENAMKLLRSALYEREMEARRKAAGELEATKSDISFGSQIRTYTLHPYQLVKDERTELKTSQSADVLDGDLDSFIHTFLVANRQAK